MDDCPICSGKKVVFTGPKQVQDCVCVRKRDIADILGKSFTGNLKFLKPDVLAKLPGVAFIYADMEEFKHYFAGYLIHKRNYTFDFMTIPQFFELKMSNQSHDALMYPDITVLYFSSVYPNRVAPLYVVELCEERKLKGKATWIVSKLSRSEIAEGFREAKESTLEYLEDLESWRLSKGKWIPIKYRQTSSKAGKTSSKAGKTSSKSSNDLMKEAGLV